MRATFEDRDAAVHEIAATFAKYKINYRDVAEVFERVENRLGRHPVIYDVEEYSVNTELGIDIVKLG